MSCLIPLQLGLELGPYSGVFNHNMSTLDDITPPPSPTLTFYRQTQTLPQPKPRRVLDTGSPRKSATVLGRQTSHQQQRYEPRMDWTSLLAEVKRDYANSRYRMCSSRCEEAIDTANDSTAIENAHLVYLHFYAASALELQVRNLHHGSSHRVELLRAARDHYRTASGLVATEHRDVSRRLLLFSLSASSLSSSSSSSSVASHSSSSSVSSDCSIATPPPATFCPSSAFAHLRRRNAPGAVIKPKKHVAFADEQPRASEPIIRPDSPTLGFDDWLGRSSPDLDAPEDPIQEHDPSAPQVDAMNPPPALSEDCSSSADTHQEHHDEPEPAKEHALRRYKSLLSSLQQQITFHATHIDAELAAPPATPSDKPPTKNHPAAPVAEELRARIQRLKADGWPRRRFDARRYETLRERAMADDDMLE